MALNSTDPDLNSSDPAVKMDDRFRTWTGTYGIHPGLHCSRFVHLPMDCSGRVMLDYYSRLKQASAGLRVHLYHSCPRWSARPPEDQTCSIRRDCLCHSTVHRRGSPCGRVHCDHLLPLDHLRRVRSGLVFPQPPDCHSSRRIDSQRRAECGTRHPIG